MKCKKCRIKFEDREMIRTKNEHNGEYYCNKCIQAARIAGITSKKKKPPK